MQQLDEMGFPVKALLPDAQGLCDVRWGVMGVAEFARVVEDDARDVGRVWWLGVGWFLWGGAIRIILFVCFLYYCILCVGSGD